MGASKLALHHLESVADVYGREHMHDIVPILIILLARHTTCVNDNSSYIS